VNAVPFAFENQTDPLSDIALPSRLTVMLSLKSAIRHALGRDRSG